MIPEVVIYVRIAGVYFLACAGAPAGQRARNFGGKADRGHRVVGEFNEKNVYSSPGNNSTRQQCRK